MQRTVPHTASDPIALFMRTYYSLLRTTGSMQIQSLEESYMAMESSLHIHARDEEGTDVSALVYTGLRLPSCIVHVDTVLLAQIEDVFEENNYPVATWERVEAPGRRRRTHWNGEAKLAVFISSRSDIDDLIPMLTAYQIEWNKIHFRLRNSPIRSFLEIHQNLSDFSEEEKQQFADALDANVEEVNRLGMALADNFIPTLRAIAGGRKHFRVEQLAASLADYRKATARWWAHIRDTGFPYGYDLENRPVYFVSSNMHSLVNVLSGFAIREREQILDFLHEAGQHELLAEYETIQLDEGLASNEPNFLYYALKKYAAAKGEMVLQRQAEAEAESGVLRIQSLRGFDVGVQLIHINQLRQDYIDPRLCDLEDSKILRESNALIMNIDYPLGVAAYDILSHLSSRVGRLAGVYIMGKAATLNGSIGDVMIPNVVHDEHSQNTYLFSNCFSAQDVSPFMTLGSVLDNQKAVTVYGTFLQNPHYMDVFYEEGYTILEMEAGAYLSAVYETARPRRHPTDEIVRLYEGALDVGIIHYASDTPFSKGENLGARSLGYNGVEPTYATTIAIVQRILEQEARRIRRLHRKKTT
ncbi:MAG: hypothetical protein K8I82_02155 [Anaerolineae bacterium]|nr:hypothetical protein [Anaerolineae bacterium]